MTTKDPKGLFQHPANGELIGEGGMSSELISVG
jgi:hypothetical protein